MCTESSGNDEEEVCESDVQDAEHHYRQCGNNKVEEEGQQKRQEGEENMVLTNVEKTTTRLLFLDE